MGAGSQLFELFFVARVQQGGAGSGQAIGQNGSVAPCNGSSDGANGSHGGSSSSSSEGSSKGGSQQQRSALFCKFLPPGAGTLPPEDNLSAFCWPLGVQAVKPSAYLVTAEFTFTLTGGDGTRLHGVCRRTHDPTYRPLPPGPGTRGGSGSVAEHKRLPQVICILSQHCWQPFFSKVLEIADQLLAPHAGLAQLPPDAPAALFLASLPRLLVAAGPPLPPLGAVLRVPLPYSAAPISVERMRRALAPPGASASAMLLGLSADAIELEVPPELGNGAANAGVSLARLLWFLTPRQAVTLVASLLLERRIILVACDAETVSAAVHAANALLYPFRWQHIYLPLLPLALKDYLAAPMPYLVGIQADCLPLLRGMALEETVLVDLDRLGSCTPELGSPGDDYFQLPFARELEDVFEVVREHIQSPTEFDSTPKCTELLQDFFLRLVGGYRKFVRPDEEVTPAALALGLDRPLPAASTFVSTGGDPRNGKGVGKGGSADDENPRAHGFVFDQAAFILSHRRKDKVAAFLQQFRNSQMLEVFITERLKLASEGYITDDPFELKVAERNTRLGLRLGIPGVGSVAVPAMAAAAAGKGRIGSLLRKGVSAVKQGGAGLAASIKQLGSAQQEADLTLAGRAHSGPNLGRISPSAHGLGLARRSPVPAAASLVAHSRGNSFSGSSRPSSRSGSFSNLPHLSRPSANLAALNGGVQPSLEQLRPDMFFGADDAEDDDASSVTSRTSQETGWAGTARASGGHAGPLAAAFNSRRSFGTLFHATTSVSTSVALPNQTPSASPLGSRAASMQHVASRLGTATTESHEQAVLQQGATEQPFSMQSCGGIPAASAAGASVGGVLAAGLLAAGLSGRAEAGSRRPSAVTAGPAASPGSLFDLASPAPQPQPKLGHPPLPRPQQLFGDAGREGAAAPPSSGGHPTTPSSVHSRSSSLGGWATFEDAHDPTGAPFGSPQAAPGSHGAPGSGFLELEEGVGPLGSGMSRSVIRQLSHSSSAAAAVALAAAPALSSSAAAGSTGLQQQQHHHQQQELQQQRLQDDCGYFSQQPVPWQGWHEQQHAEPQPPTPCWQQQQAQLPASPYDQPRAWACQSSGAAQPGSLYDSRQEAAFIPQQQQQQQQPEGLLAAAPKQPPAVLDGVSAGWMPYYQQPAAGGPAGCRAPPAVALPAVCRMSAHSPLAAGIASVQRIASIGHLSAPPDMRRTSSSSCGGGAGSGVSWSGSGSGSGAASPPRQAPAAGQALFADLAQQAVADACERAPARHRTSSSCAATADLHHSPLRLSSTSSWAEFAEAPAPGYTGNPFEQPPTPPWPAAGTHQQGQSYDHLNPTPPPPQHHAPPQFQEHGQLRRAAARTSSGFGDFAGGGVLASQLSSLQLT